MPTVRSACTATPPRRSWTCRAAHGQPTTGENQFESDPRGAKNKVDFVKTTTTTFGLQVEQQLGVGTLYADASTREKKLNGLSYDGFGDTLRQQKLEENLASLRYRLPINGGHSVVFGADAQEAKTSADQNAYYDFAPPSGSRASTSTACSPKARSAPPTALTSPWARAASTPPTSWK